MHVYLQRSEARLLNYFVLLILLVLSSACADTHSEAEARKMARSFIHDYYVQDDLKKASAYTTQAAAQTLGKQLETIESADVLEPAADKPEIKIKLLNNDFHSDAQTSFVWKVTSDKANTLYVKTMLAYSKELNTWQITDFVENEKDY